MKTHRLSRKLNKKYILVLNEYLMVLSSEKVGLSKTSTPYEYELVLGFPVYDDEDELQDHYLICYDENSETFKILGSDECYQADLEHYIIKQIIQFLNFIDPLNISTLTLE